jgi:hypothetical protein
MGEQRELAPVDVDLDLAALAIGVAGLEADDVAGRWVTTA